MSFLLNSTGGCCGSNRLYSDIFNVPTVNDDVHTHEICQGQGAYREYIITDVTDTDITCRVTSMRIDPDESYLERYRDEFQLSVDMTEIDRHTEFDESFVDEDGDSAFDKNNDEYLPVKDVFYRDGRLYRAKDYHRVTLPELLEKYRASLPYQVGDVRVFKR